MSVMKTGLAMIEGIYGRDGDGFEIGQDYLTNLVMFSKDKFRLDVIGMYLEAMNPATCISSASQGTRLDRHFQPWEIPIYEWVNGAAIPRKLTDFSRTPLRTYYLQKAGEPLYHLVNEPSITTATKFKAGVSPGRDCLCVAIPASVPLIWLPARDWNTELQGRRFVLST